MSKVKLSSENIAIALRKGEGSFSIKKKGNQYYLYKATSKKGKTTWELLGNIKDLEPNDKNLIKAKAVIVGKEAKELYEKVRTGKTVKEEAVNEFKKLLER